MREATDSIQLAVMNLPRGRRLRFALSTWQGREGLDIRVHVFDPDANDWLPLRQGIRIPLEQAGEFRELVSRACERIAQRGAPSQDGSTAPLVPPRTPSGDPLQEEDEGATEHDPEEGMEKYLGSLDNP